MTPFLAAFIPPLTALLFLLTAPHGPAVVLLLAGLLAVLVCFDGVKPKPQRALEPGAGFDAIVVALAAIQLANIVLLSAVPGRGLLDTMLSILLVGISTASSVVTAHELIHRRDRPMRGLGRVLLWTALYDHFQVEHLRGHHARAGTGDDPSTARLGESFWHYALRSVPGELASALRIDARRVLLGVALEAAMVLSLGLAFGSRALQLFVAQVVVAWSLIAAVNYLQHWGLERIGRRFTSAVAWDCDSALTHYLLLGVSRHADHHLHPARSFAALGPTPGSPKLPHGYVRMIILILFFNRRAKELLARSITEKRR